MAPPARRTKARGGQARESVTAVWLDEFLASVPMPKAQSFVLHLSEEDRAKFEAVRQAIRSGRAKYPAVTYAKQLKKELGLTRSPKSIAYALTKDD